MNWQIFSSVAFCSVCCSWSLSLLSAEASKPQDLHPAQTKSLSQACILVCLGWLRHLILAYLPIQGPSHPSPHTIPSPQPFGPRRCHLTPRPWSIDPTFSLHEPCFLKPQNPKTLNPCFYNVPLLPRKTR